MDRPAWRCIDTAEAPPVLRSVDLPSTRVKLGVFVMAALAALAVCQPRAQVDSSVGDRVMALTRDSQWTAAATVPVKFRTYHPQGMVKIADRFVVSSVEVRRPTTRLPQPIDGHDRDAGEGVGHLFQIDMAGNLLADLQIGEGSIYHPGGIDYDGSYVWVPVAEYRPDSRSIVYRVDPRTMKAVEVLRFEDHLGAVVHNTDDRTLHAVSWGSRRFYRWTLDRNGRVASATARTQPLRTPNPSHYVDAQDCKYAPRGRMLCTGVTELRQPGSHSPFRLGGIELIDLRDGRPLQQVPVQLWTRGGRAMTQNPTWIEPRGDGLRAYFMPEDDEARIYIYDVAVK